VKILYCALAVPLDGTDGGATHVAEVTNGLAARGHELWVIGRGDEARAAPRLHARVTTVRTPRTAALLMMPTVRRTVATFRPDAVIERFYTFAGAGMLAAWQAGIPALLEVNAPVTDPPGSRKETLDCLTGRPMRRWATQQCRWADAIVTPLATTVPDAVRNRVVPLHWGANVVHFDPDAHPRTVPHIVNLRARLGLPPDAAVIGFHGSFRAWHGAADALRAFALVRQSCPNAYLLLIGDGPERAALERDARAGADAAHIRFTGAVPYAAMPDYLALCDVSVAPFAPRRYPSLTHFGFYWSPLKVWEAMAMRLPVVTTAVPPLTEIIADCGVAVPEGDRDALTAALTHLLMHPQERAAMGARGRERVVSQYSWEAHCLALESVLHTIVAKHATGHRR